MLSAYYPHCHLLLEQKYSVNLQWIRHFPVRLLGHISGKQAQSGEQLYPPSHAAPAVNIAEEVL